MPSEEIEFLVNKEKERQSKRHVGILAQELKEIYPQLIDVDDDGYYSIRYMELIPILIRSIQELKMQLDAVTTGNRN